MKALRLFILWWTKDEDTTTLYALQTENTTRIYKWNVLIIMKWLSMCFCQQQLWFYKKNTYAKKTPNFQSYFVYIIYERLKLFTDFFCENDWLSPRTA